MNNNNNTPVAHKQNPKTNPNGDGTVYQLKNGKWKAEFVIGYDSQTGKPIRPSKTSKNKGVVNDWLDEQKRKYGKSKGAIDKSKKLFKDAAEGYFKHQIALSVSGLVSSHTVGLREGIYENYILPSFGTRKLTDITSKTISDFLKSLIEEHQLTRTVGIAKTIISQIYQFAVNEGYCKDNPTDAVKLPKKTKAQKDNEAAKKYSRDIPEEMQLKILEASVANPLIYTVLRIMLYSGLRIGEVLALRWKDINFRTHYLYVREAIVSNTVFDDNGKVSKHYTSLGNPKTAYSNRDLGMGDELEAVFFAWRRHLVSRNCPEEVLKGNGFVICNRNWTNYTESGFRSIFKRFIAKNIDNFVVDGLCNHSFRHAYATNMLDFGFTIREIQTNLGHKDPQTTLGYIGSDKVIDKLAAAKKYEKSLSERNQAISDFNDNSVISSSDDTAMKQQ